MTWEITSTSNSNLIHHTLNKLNQHITFSRWNIATFKNKRVYTLVKQNSVLLQHERSLYTNILSFGVLEDVFCTYWWLGFIT